MVTKYLGLARKNLKYIIGGVILLAVAFFIFAGSNGNGTTEEATVSIRNVVEQVRVSGRVQAVESADLSFQASGKVTSISVSEGDTVVRGQVLAQLDTRELQADLRDAQAQVAIREANIDNTRVNIDDVRAQQDVLVENAKRKLFSSDLEMVPWSDSLSVDSPNILGSYNGPEGSYKVRIFREEANRNNFRVRVFGVETWEGELEENRTLPLGTKGLFIQISDDLESYDNTTWTLSIPNTFGASYTTNKNAYDEAVKNRTIAIREAEEALAQTNSGASSVAEAELLQAQARADRILAEIEQRIIRAPFDGVITEQNGNVGETVASTDTVLRIISDQAFEITAQLPEVDSVKVSPGDIASITLDAYPGQTFSAEVQVVSVGETLNEGVPEYEMILQFTEEDPRIRSGMTADIQIITDIREGVLSIPQRAITVTDGAATVQRITANGETATTSIEFGLIGSDSYVELLSGLAEGERVLIQN